MAGLIETKQIGILFAIPYVILSVIKIREWLDKIRRKEVNIYLYNSRQYTKRNKGVITKHIMALPTEIKYV